MKFSEFLNESSNIEDDAKEIKKLFDLSDQLNGGDYNDKFTLSDDRKLAWLLTGFHDKHKMKYKDYMKEKGAK